MKQEKKITPASLLSYLKKLLTYANITCEMPQYLNNYTEFTLVRKYFLGSVHFELCQFTGLPADVEEEERERASTFFCHSFALPALLLRKEILPGDIKIIRSYLARKTRFFMNFYTQYEKDFARIE